MNVVFEISMGNRVMITDVKSIKEGKSILIAWIKEDTPNNGMMCRNRLSWLEKYGSPYVVEDYDVVGVHTI